MSAGDPLGNIFTNYLLWDLFIYFFFLIFNRPKCMESYQELFLHVKQTYTSDLNPPDKVETASVQRLSGIISFSCLLIWSILILMLMKPWVIPGLALCILDQVSYCAVSNYSDKNLVQTKELPTRVYKNCCKVEKKLKRWSRIKATSSATWEPVAGQESLASTYFQVVVVRNVVCVSGRRVGNTMYTTSWIITSPLS